MFLLYMCQVFCLESLDISLLSVNFCKFVTALHSCQQLLLLSANRKAQKVQLFFVKYFTSFKKQ